MKNFKQYYLANEGIASTLASAKDTVVDKARDVAGRAVEVGGDIKKGAEEMFDPEGVVSGDAQLSDIESIETYEDLKEVINGITKQKQHAGIKDTIVGAVVDEIPGLGIAKTAVDVVKAIADKPDEIKTQTGSVIDKLDVDDQLATIVADPIEDKFLAHVLDQIKNETGPIPPDWDINNELKQYLSTKFSGRTVTGDQA